MWREWIRRYAPAEVCGVVGALAGYLVVWGLVRHSAAAAYGATAAENAAYYGFLLARRAGSVRALLVEFGPAEVLDSLAVRPACCAAAVALLGPVAGVLAGKLAADLVFYAPVIATYEFARARKEVV
jgi:hypothetical protein